MKVNLFFCVFISAVFMLLLISCGGVEPTVTLQPTFTPTPMPTLPPIPTSTPIPTPLIVEPTTTPTPRPTATATPLPPTPVPATATPTPIPTQVLPTATPIPTLRPTPTATPTPTQIPPTPTPTPTPTPSPTPTATPTPTPIPTPTPPPNIFDDFGFTIALDEDAGFSSSNLTISGMIKDAADEQQGLLTFEYTGSNVIIFWLPATDDLPAAVIESTYQLLRDSQPSNILTPVSDGDISIDGEPGKFGGFVATDASGENAGGGLIAAWTCHERSITLSLIVTGFDPTSLQIRFDRLISGFKCN